MPNYGKDTIGGTNTVVAADFKRFCKFTSPSGISEADSITVYADRPGTGGQYAIRGGIYTDNAGVPNALVANSAIEINSNIARNTPQWYSISYTTKPTLSPNTPYWLGFQWAKETKYFWDAGSPSQRASVSDAYADGLADPYGTGIGYAAEGMSVYVSYTAGGIQNLAGVSNGIASVTGIAKASRRIAGATTCIASVTGATKVSKKLVGVITCAGTTAGLIKVSKKIAGLVSGIASTTGSLTVTAAGVLLAGVVSGFASVAGVIKCIRPIAGLSAGLASVSGGVKLTKKLSGAVSGIASITGIARVKRRLAGAASGLTTAGGSLSIMGLLKLLAGAISGIATVAGSLSVRLKARFFTFTNVDPATFRNVVDDIKFVDAEEIIYK